MHAEPRVSSGQSSQLLYGRGVELLEARDDWRRARGEDRYEGWIHVGYLGATSATPAELSWPGARVTADHAPTRISLGCAVRANDTRRVLPLGALLRDETLESGEAVALTSLAERFPRDARALTDTALRHYEGTSYQWGGGTPWGADCSGLVQSAFRLHGVVLPRDAWQQIACGRDAGADIDALEPADLLFFSDRADRRITHVGISLGARRMVHLALGRGGYAVEQLDDSRDGYVVRLRERFVGARTGLFD